MPRLSLLSPLVIMLTLSGCAPLTPKPSPERLTATPAIDVAKVCQVWKPVLYSRKLDTVETIQQAQANNAARDAFCN